MQLIILNLDRGAEMMGRDAAETLPSGQRSSLLCGSSVNQTGRQLLGEREGGGEGGRGLAHIIAGGGWRRGEASVRSGGAGWWAWAAAARRLSSLPRPNVDKAERGWATCSCSSSWSTPKSGIQRRAKVRRQMVQPGRLDRPQRAVRRQKYEQSCMRVIRGESICEKITTAWVWLFAPIRVFPQRNEEETGSVWHILCVGAQVETTHVQ